MKARAYRRRYSDRRGATMVEFAFVAPVMFLLIFASVEFGRVNILRNTANNAAYEAARHVIVPGATSQEAIAIAEDMLQIIRVTNANVTMTPAEVDESTERVTVTVSIPLNDNAWILPRFTEDLSIRAQSTLTTERYGGLVPTNGGRTAK